MLVIRAFLTASHLLHRGHIITTPRKWSVGEAVQVCAFVSGATDGENEVAIQVTAESDSTEVLVSGHIIIPQGRFSFQLYKCCLGLAVWLNFM